MNKTYTLHDITHEMLAFSQTPAFQRSTTPLWSFLQYLEGKSVPFDLPDSPNFDKEVFIQCYNEYQALKNK